MAKTTKRIGILTSGGDCPGLNAAIRGVAKAAIREYGFDVYGIKNGYKGLIENDVIKINDASLSGILTIGGTILGTSRQPFKKLKKAQSKIDSMIATYKSIDLDCLVTLGGNGTHKTANLLANEGLNVIGLPKTIDNDLYGTDVTFGFQSAVDIASDVIDRIHSTAESHGRVMIIELMGHNAGWLTLHAGVAGGADVILIPEFPYSIDRVIEKLEERAEKGKNFSIIAVAEGALSMDESNMSREQFKAFRSMQSYPSLGYRIAKEITAKIEVDTRVTVPGYQQRGGITCPFDRILATKLGTYAAQMIANDDFGKMVVVLGTDIDAIPLEDTAGKIKLVTDDCKLLSSARMIGTSFGQPR